MRQKLANMLLWYQMRGFPYCIAPIQPKSLIIKKGNLNSKVALVIPQESSHTLISGDHRNLLINIIYALKQEPKEILLLGYGQFPGCQSLIKMFPKCEYFVVFGGIGTEDQQDWQQQSASMASQPAFIFTHTLAELADNPETKRETWNHLQMLHR